MIYCLKMRFINCKIKLPQQCWKQVLLFIVLTLDAGFFGQAVFNQKFHLNKSHIPESSHMIKASL